MTGTPVLRKALMRDVQNIHALLMESARQGLLLPRSLNQIYTCLRDFFVLDAGEGAPLVGCCALALMWENMAEVRSLMVTEAYRRQGLAVRLLNACLEDAAGLGVTNVFALTYQVKFFANAGFMEVAKESLPQKIWTDCIHCPKFPNCDETAMVRPI